MRDVPELVELFGVPDTFVSGLGNIENIGGGCYRFTFYAVQDCQGRREFVVAAKLIMPEAAIPGAMHRTATETKACACINARMMVMN